ncbi:MAG: hypothetical protein ACKO4Z_04225 [Planctomycetota bacterium]
MPARVGLFPLLALTLASASAADLPPELVGQFTRQVQPLLVNRCAAGACHGGPAGHEPRFERGPASTRPDRVDTLANIATFLETVGPDRDPATLVRMLAATHPTDAGRSRRVAAPLTAHERRTLESWLAQVRMAETRPRPDARVRQASATAPAEPNRFRAMLEAEANPAPLEPPRDPPGVIFKRDDGTTPEPPLAPTPPEP